MFRSTRSAAKRAALKDLVSPDNIQCSSPKVPTISTKQKENVKTKIKVIRTESFLETFPGRLEWKRRHFEKPVTSTPTATAKSASSKTKKDVQNCFGFIDSSESDGEKDYSTLISPIPKTKVPTSTLQTETVKPSILPPLGPSDLAREEETQSSHRPNSIAKNNEPSCAVQIAKDKSSLAREPVSSIAVKEKEIQSSRRTRSNSISENKDGKSALQVAKETSLLPGLDSSIFAIEKETQSDRRTRSRSNLIPENKSIKSVVQIAKEKSTLPDPASSIAVNEKEIQSNCRTRSKLISTIKAKSVVQIAKARSPTPPPPDLSSSIFITEKETQPQPSRITRSKTIPKKKAKLAAKTTKTKARSSTPPPDLSSSIFVDEVNEQYLRIKPSDIGNPGVEVKDFNDLLQRYNFDEDKEEEFRIDPARAAKTYPSKRSSNSITKGQIKKSKTKLAAPQTKAKKVKRVNEKTKKVKPTGSKQFGKKNAYEDDDEATKQWLEMKNKEFAEILKVNLVVEHSGT